PIPGPKGNSEVSMKSPTQGRIHRRRSRFLVVEFLEDRFLLSSSAFGPVVFGPTPPDHYSNSEIAAGWNGSFREASSDNHPTTGALPPVDTAGASMPSPNSLPSGPYAGGDFTNGLAVNCAPATPVFVSAPPVFTLPPIDLRPPSRPADQPPRIPLDGTGGVNWNLPTGVFVYVTTVTMRLDNSGSGVTRAPLVSQALPSAP